MDAAALGQWLAVLDRLSYYELFRAPPGATHDALRAAFHAFADDFHPDGHRWRPPDDQRAIGTIYRRGAEAWRVLSEPALRARYDAALASGVVRPEELVVERATARPAGPGAGRLVEKIRSPGARPFVVRAEELLKKGDPRQAKIQLVLAMHMERDNPALEAFGRELDRALATKSERPAPTSKT